MDAAEEVKRLTSVALARELTGEAAERFCQDFEGLEEWITKADETTRSIEGKEGASSGEQVQENDNSRPTMLRDLFPRTGEEIRILLS